MMPISRTNLSALAFTGDCCLACFFELSVSICPILNAIHFFYLAITLPELILQEREYHCTDVVFASRLICQLDQLIACHLRRTALHHGDDLFLGEYTPQAIAAEHKMISSLDNTGCDVRA